MNLNLTRCIVFIFLYFFSFLSFRFIFFLLLALSFSLTTATKSSCSRPFLFAYPMPTFFSRSNIFFLCHLDYGILFIHIWLTFINTYKIYYFIIELKHVIKWWKISCALFSYAVILCPFFFVICSLLLCSCPFFVFWFWPVVLFLAICHLLSTVVLIFFSSTVLLLVICALALY